MDAYISRIPGTFHAQVKSLKFSRHKGYHHVHYFVGFPYNLQLMLFSTYASLCTCVTNMELLIPG